MSPKGNLSDLISWFVVMTAAAAARDFFVFVIGTAFFGSGTFIVTPSPKSIM
jgi:hypothetical protein